jgi:hypothetical protein
MLHDIFLPKEIRVKSLVCGEPVVALCTVRWLIDGDECVCECGKERLKEAEDYTYACDGLVADLDIAFRVDLERC